MLKEGNVKIQDLLIDIQNKNRIRPKIDLYFKKKGNYSKTWTVLIIVLFFILSVFPAPFSNIKIARADELSDLNNKLNELNQQINQINSQLIAKRQEKKTLQNEIAIFDAQIQQIELQIQATEAEIAKIQKEIDNTIARIKEAENELERQKEILKENLRILYEEGQISAVEVVASSDNFSEFMNRTEYLKSIQDKVSETIDKINQLKAELDAKRKELETKKTEQVTLKNQQEGQRQGLAAQRTAKNSLLAYTKGEEAAYQKNLKELQASYQIIQSQIASFINKGNFVSQGTVKKGSIIGYEGNSGYSSGPHLHFEVRTTSGQKLNPLGFLGSSMIWPMNNYVITQGFGENTELYGPGGHPGVDLAGPYGEPVKAVADGDIIFSGGSAANTYPNGPLSYGKYVIINHNNGYLTLYAHLQ